VILGRTPAGLIKTKSDGGLRAVNCACCGGECPCRFVIAPSSILNILSNVTTGSQCALFGQAPTYFYQDEYGFNAEWSETGSSFFSVFIYNAGDPCIFMEFSEANESGLSTMYAGDFLGKQPFDCGGLSLSNFNINGITLTSYYEVFDSGAPTTTPSFVFT
jgi:hypothetical protein